MSIKWTVKDCIAHLQELRNPFEKVNQKPKLSEVINSIRGNGEKKIPLEIL